MKPEEVCKKLLELCRAEGATDVIASVSEFEEGMIRFSNNEVIISDDLVETTCSIFVKVESRKASTTLADLSSGSLRSAAKKVVSAAKNTPPGDIYAPLPNGPFQYDPMLLKQKKVSVEPEDLTGWTQQAIEAGTKEGASRMAGSLIARNADLTFMTTGGAEGQAQGSSLEISVRAFGEGLASGHGVSISASENDFDPTRAGSEAGRLAKMARSPVPAEAGERQAVLGPLVFADLVNQFGRSASAFHVDSGLSFLGGKIGEKVASEKFTLLDDPTLVGTYGSAPFDAEGSPTKANKIVSNGILRTYLHNATTAKKYGTENTSNAGLIAPHPFNLVVPPGEMTLDELISSVDDGIYVTNDWYLRYQNYSSGDFSTIPRDAMFLIKNGELSSSVRELRISENMLNIFKNLEGSTSERVWIKWWEVDVPTLCPSVKVSTMKFTRSSQ